MTAKRAEFRGASPPRTPTPKSSVPHTPEDIANGGVPPPVEIEGAASGR